MSANLRHPVRGGRVSTFLIATAIVSGLASATALADQHTDDAKLGRSVYDDLAKKNQIVNDSPYAKILQTVGARIAHAGGVPERFYVVRGNQLNAFSAPGGYVFVNEGLLRSADNVPELANVLGHETAHVALGDVNARTQQKTTRESVFGFLHKHFVKSKGQENTFDVATAAGNYSFLNFTRQQEYAADQFGATIAARAGFDPWGMIWYARAVERLDGDAGYEQYVEHHPSTKDRIARLESYFKAHPKTFKHWSSVPPAAIGLPS
jgi:predicted Zn-dependent protease